MPTWLKVLLIVGGIFVVLVVGVIAVTVIVARKYGPAIVKNIEQAGDEAKEYGRRTDNEGCLNEAVARHARAEGLGDLFKNTLFLRICLDSSRPTPGFCDNVPRQFEFTRGAQWQLERCRHYGLSPEKQCGQLFQQVQQFCEARHEYTNVEPQESNTDYGNTNDEPPPPPTLPPPPAPRRTTNAR
ncbi:MAG TPA: hypothetical protein VFA21_08490 [Pyrinomonadaceae bacterium]|jgi:hypothetical protein|nr:hypothetical protein [Pyrinomonadaceae bacterium]